MDQTIEVLKFEIGKKAIIPSLRKICLATLFSLKLCLNIVVKENHLTIEGDYVRAEESEYLHKGIAKRSFTRDFVLADTLHVEDVTFSEGILRVTLKQIVPEEQKPKKIKIN